ncbi:hypothetical protein SAMN05192534_12125 [Alteribacillus persepolensis]|uniref:Zn-ribbon domain-containing OB-fold protein n=1 Tax=Alteribacillus persepolensis TaxID=568899 RepID=A0A1G8HS81_9BACI|nr:Zn-ribbon domain-containing OB-fold protein [Alteribacillus persepolensis]SDI09515.1 hypothetical protein SAMN05192534_12125 [Alteribacillus persepolensis]
MADHSGKNFPTPTKETAPYWEGCRNHQLVIQQCPKCEYYQFYPRMMCTHCSHGYMDWVTVSGNGRVISFTVIRRPISPAYKAEAPYVVALIKLDEGPTMMSNIVECEPEKVFIGMKVNVVFEDWSEDISIPKFVPQK